MGQTPVNNAKVRHYESMLGPEKSLLYDPYAKAMYNEGWVHEWFLGYEGTADLFKSMPGLLEMIAVRTKWLDDAILSTIKDNHSRSKSSSGQARQQLVILKAGFDTRAFRLQLGNKVHVFEIDETAVFEEKLDKLLQASRNSNDLHVAKRLASKKITYVPASRKHGLARTDGYSWEKPTIVVMEDITQYVSKEVTADQLRKIAKVIPKGSTLLLTYADQDCWDNPARVGNPAVVKRVLECSGNEKWITGWTPAEMKSFLDDLGYYVEWDATSAESYHMYFKDLDRTLKPKDVLSMERFVIAKKRDELIPW